MWRRILEHDALSAAGSDCFAWQDEHGSPADFVPASPGYDRSPALHFHLRKIAGEFTLMSSIDAQTAIRQTRA
jgi:hypothetical protein